jgi:CRISPR-associated protein Csm5
MNYDVTITTLTPLHIGTGTELLNDYDFIVDRDRGKTYRLNVDAVFDYVLPDEPGKFNQALLKQSPTKLIKVDDLKRHPELATYILSGHPQPKSVGAGRIKEQVKDVRGKLYLPGSSLKGALRTAIARSIAGSDNIKPKLQVKTTKNQRGRVNPKQADDWIERTIFRVERDQIARGRNEMNYDILRALQVADSRPVEVSPLLINVRIVKGNQLESPVDVEAVPPNTTFETTIHTEKFLYQDQADKLGWDKERTKWLYNLPIAGRNVAVKRFAQEIAYFTDVGLTDLVRVYKVWQSELSSMRGSNDFFLQLGWGGGWENKTLGQALLAPDEQDFADLRDTFDLGRPPRSKDWRAKPGTTFPSSRRLVVNNQNRPVAPLGWVKVTVTQKL